MSKQISAEPVTVVFNWKVKPGKEQLFEALMHDIHKAARTFPGHLGVTTLRSPSGGAVFQTVLRFDSVAHLDAWLKSPIRQKLVKPVEKIASEEVYRATGLETWFDVPGHTVTPPPKWKMVITTSIAIYPLSLLYGWFVAPHVLGWPIAARALILPAVAPFVLTFWFMPFLTQRVFKRWLYKAPSQN